jgi:hypothetical protein
MRLLIDRLDAGRDGSYLNFVEQRTTKWRRLLFGFHCFFLPSDACANAGAHATRKTA